MNRLPFLPSFTSILLLAAILRFYALEADAPLHLSLYPGLSNDGVNTVAAARDYLLFGSWSPPWRMTNLYEKFPGASWLAFPFFALLGVGYWQANFMAVIPGLLSIALFASFARRQFGTRAALLVALFMAASYPYVVYNRTPIIYTLLACALGLALVLWGRGLRNPAWFLPSLLITALSIVFIKLPAVSLLPASLLGLLILARRRQGGRKLLLGLPAAGLLAAAVLFVVVAPSANTTVRRIAVETLTRSFSPSLSLEENVRFGVQAVLQFGIYSSFFVRMLPLFLLSFGYLFFRGAQLLSRERPQLPVAEIVALVYLVTTAAMLAFARSQATRYMILLIPPMSMVAALALDRWLLSRQIVLPHRFGRLYPVYVQLAATYLLYQVGAAALKLAIVARTQTGLGDARTILPTPVLYTLLSAALILAIGVTLWFLWRVKERRQVTINRPAVRGSRAIALAAVVLLVGGDLYQYVSWARAPQYSIIEASRDLARELDDDAIIGGDYAYPLALESELRASYFVPSVHVRRSLESVPFTHLAIGQSGSLLIEGSLSNRIASDMPWLLPHLELIKTYELRDILVQVYEVIR